MELSVSPNCSTGVRPANLIEGVVCYEALSFVRITSCLLS
jgi:hypothetical protein